RRPAAYGGTRGDVRRSPVTEKRYRLAVDRHRCRSRTADSRDRGSGTGDQGMGRRTFASADSAAAYPPRHPVRYQHRGSRTSGGRGGFVTDTLTPDTLVPAEQPTMYFIGVTTGSSAIHRVFDAWRPLLGLDDVALTGIDVPLDASPQAYRDVVEFL